jgi:polyisoprenoid-binding protein YceI
MKKIMIASISALLVTGTISAQKVVTKDAKVTFDATSSIESIKATNKSGSVALNTLNGDVAARVQVKNFIFAQALMQEHFNENYMESNKYPSATLKGKVTNIGELQLSKNGTYKANVQGTLEMHGITNNVTVPATLIVNNGTINFKANFNVLCADYKIDIPSVVADKVAKEVKINIEGVLSNQ